MANTIKLKRSASPNTPPTTAQLELGEVAINTYDGKMYIKKNVSGTESIVEVGSGASVDLLNVTTGIASPDYIQFDTGATNTPAVGKIYWDAGEGSFLYTLSGGNVAQNLHPGSELVYNGTGAALTKGQVVYLNGAQGQRPSVALALATSDTTSARTIGIVAETIANGAEGWIRTSGILEGFDTSAFTDGAQLYLSGTTAGAMTATKPVAPTHLVYTARVIKSHATAGRILVGIQNGYELDEIHDVLITSPVGDNEVLAYNSATGLWKNETIVSALGYTPANKAGDTFTGAVTFPGGSLVSTDGGIRARFNNGNTGAVYFGSGDNYLYYDGANFTLNGGYVYNANSFHAPIFYDSNNTAYWLDPAGNSVFSAFNIGGGEVYFYGSATNAVSIRTGAGGAYKYFTFDASGNFYALNGAVYGDTFYDQANTGYYANPAGTSVLNYVEANTYTGTNFVATNAFYVNGYSYYLNSTNGGWYSNARIQSEVDLRAPIFYDSANTNYYLDLAGNSTVYNLNVYGNSGIYVSDNAATTSYVQVGTDFVYGESGAYSFSFYAGNYYNWVSAGGGNFGVGTTTPGVKLDVAGSIRASQSINVGSGGTYAAGSIYSDANWGMIFRAYQASPNEAQFLWTSSPDNELLRIDNAGNLISPFSVRAPAFYDSQNTAYYLDPASTGTSLLVAGGAYAAGQVRATGWWGDPSASATGLGIEIGESVGTGFILSYNRDAATYGPMQFEATSYNFANVGGSYVTVANSVRSPIFYDSNDTRYYVDAASTSVLGQINFGDSTKFIRGGASGQIILGAGSANDAYIQVGGSYYPIWNSGNFTPGNYLPLTGGTISGVLTVQSSNDAQLYLNGNGTTWAGISWNDVGGTDYMWYYGGTSTFAIGGGGSSVASKKLHVHGGTTIGSGLVGTSVAANGLLVETRVDAPIFYDSDNTGYYLNPNATSYLNTLSTREAIGSGTAASFVYIAPTLYYYWTKIANVSGGDASATILITSKYDVNYVNFASALLTISAWNGSTASAKLEAISGCDVGMDVRIDNNNDVWLQVGSPWSSNLSWKVINKVGNPTVYYASPTQQTTTPANSTSISYGQTMRGTQGAMSSATVTNISNTVFGGLTARADVRAPIFYDYDNTTYYLDPAGSTSLRTVGDWRSDSSAWTGEFNGKIQYHASNWYFQAAGSWEFRRSDSANAFYVTQGGVAGASSDFRAPIFYDSNNTAYYLNPESTSVLYEVSTYYIRNKQTGNRALYIDGTTWNQFADPDGATKLWLGGTLDPYNYYNGNVHYFRSAAGSNYATISSGQMQVLGGRPITISSSTGSVQINGDSGGWSNGLLFYGSSSTYRGGFGALGNADSLSYYWIGSDYNTATLYIYASGFAQASGSLRAPIFYDSNDTGYYVDAASNTVLNTLYLRNSGIPVQAKFAQASQFGYSSSYRTVVLGNEYLTTISMGVDVSGNASGSFNGQGEGREVIFRNGVNFITPNSANNSYLTPLNMTDGYVTSSGSFRAPYFYDSDNTGYYVDPAGTSNLNVAQAITLRAMSNVPGNYGGISSSWGGNSGYPTLYGDTDDRWVMLINPHISYTQNGVNGFTGTMTGSTIRMAGNPAASTYWDIGVGTSGLGADVFGIGRAAQWNSYWDSSGNVWSRTSHRAPIFYDSNDTGYYVDPNSTSVLNTITVVNGISAYDAAWGSDPYGKIGVTRGSDANYSYYGLTRAGQLGMGMGIDTSNQFWIGGTTPGYGSTRSNTWFYMNTSGDVWANSSYRAPLFYDSNNTGYYVDPAGYSKLYSLEAALNDNKLWLRGIGDSNHYLWNAADDYEELVAYTGTGFRITSSSTGSTVFVAYGSANGGYTLSPASSRAPVFYDSDNTSYYVDAASESVLSTLTLMGELNLSASGTNYVDHSGTITFRNQANYVNSATLTTGGDFTASGNVTAYSDARLKDNVETVSNALDLVSAMRGVTYTRKDTGSEGIGVIAQEMLEVIPQVVQQGEDGTLSVAYGNLVGVLIEAIKDQQSQINALESKLEAILAKLK